MGELASLAAAATWAVASVLFARAGTRIGPEALNLAKCALGCLMLGVVQLATLGVLSTGPSMEALFWLALSALVGLSIGDSAFFGALNRLGPRRALVFWSLSPPMTAGLAAVLLGEPVSVVMLSGMACTVVGVAWVVLERTPDGAGNEPTGPPAAELRIGVVLGVLAALGQALGNIWTKKGGVGLDTVEVSVLRLGFGAAFLAVQVVAFGHGRQLFRLAEPRTGIQVLAGTAVGTAAGIYLMVYGLQHTYAAVAATLTSTSPIFVLPVAIFVLEERVSARAILGALMAVGGVAVLSFS